MFEVLIWFVPIAVTALGLWRPQAGLLAFAASLPLFGSPPGGPYLLALDAACLAAILTAWRGGKARPTPLEWPLVAALIVSCVSLVPLAYLPPSLRPGVVLDLLGSLPAVQSWSALYTWRVVVDLALGVGLFWAYRRCFAGRSPRSLALALAAGLALVVLLGLAGQLDVVSLDAYRPTQAAQLAPPRLQSLFFLSGWLSQYLVLSTPIALAALATGGRWLQRLTVPLAASSLASLALTQQRGAWVAAAAQMLCGAILVLRWRRGSIRLRQVTLAAAYSGGLAVVILLTVTSSLEPLIERAQSIRSAMVPRAEVWTAAAEMFRERPLLGWGLGSFAAAYEARHPRGEGIRVGSKDSAHNLYFQVAAEQGLLGLAALALVAWATWLCLMQRGRTPDPWALALGLCLLGSAVYGFGQYMFYMRSLAWLHWLLLGAIATIGPQRDRPDVRRLARWVAAGALLLLPLRAVFSTPPGFADSRSFGFHAPEPNPHGSFQWTEGVAARRLEWKGDTLVLDLANGHPRAAERPVTVGIEVDGKQLAELSIAGGWEEHRFELGSPTKESIVLTIRAHPTFRPFNDFRRWAELSSSVDIRSLGIAVKDLRWAEPTRRP